MSIHGEQLDGGCEATQPGAQWNQLEYSLDPAARFYYMYITFAQGAVHSAPLDRGADQAGMLRLQLARSIHVVLACERGYMRSRERECVEGGLSGGT